MEDLAWEKVTIKALLDISLITANLMKVGIESLFSEFLSQKGVFNKNIHTRH